MPNKVLFGPEKLASTSVLGVFKLSTTGYGLGIENDGTIYVNEAASSQIKAGNASYRAIVPLHQHESVFYGLAKAAGDSTQAASSNTVGTYTDNAKTAIQNMLSVAPTASPIFTGSISMGRYTSYTIGENSVALGDDVMALDYGSVALNVGNVAGSAGSLAINLHNNAMGVATFVGGINNYNFGTASYVLGQHSVNDPYIAQYDITGDNTAPDWTASTSYNVGDIVWYMPTGSGWKLYKCLEANSDSTFDEDKWSNSIYGKFIERIGNGTAPWQNQDNNWGAASNARTLDWDGNEYLKGYLYVGCNADSSGGTRIPHDIQVNGTSVVSSGVANIPLASSNAPGVAKIRAGYGINISNGELFINKAVVSNIKAGTNTFLPIVPYNQHEAVFYGLAKAAGDTTQASATENVGYYTEEAKGKIYEMFNRPITITTSSISLTAVQGVRYVCGEMTSITFTAPASGCVDLLFKSGSTPTNLTISSAKSGVSAIKWANGFDPVNTEANTIYEINILDGEYGVACKWT